MSLFNHERIRPLEDSKINVDLVTYFAKNITISSLGSRKNIGKFRNTSSVIHIFGGFYGYALIHSESLDNNRRVYNISPTLQQCCVYQENYKTHLFIYNSSNKKWYYYIPRDGLAFGSTVPDDDKIEIQLSDGFERRNEQGRFDMDEQFRLTLIPDVSYLTFSSDKPELKNNIYDDYLLALTDSMTPIQGIMRLTIDFDKIDVEINKIFGIKSSLESSDKEIIFTPNTIRTYCVYNVPLELYYSTSGQVTDRRLQHTAELIENFKGFYAYLDLARIKIDSFGQNTKENQCERVLLCRINDRLRLFCGKQRLNNKHKQYTEFEEFKTVNLRFGSAEASSLMFGGQFTFRTIKITLVDEGKQSKGTQRKGKQRKGKERKELSFNININKDLLVFPLRPLSAKDPIIDIIPETLLPNQGYVSVSIDSHKTDFKFIVQPYTILYDLIRQKNKIIQGKIVERIDPIRTKSGANIPKEISQIIADYSLKGSKNTHHNY